MWSLRALQLVTLWLLPLAAAYDMIPRWGHAATYISSPPSLLIQGGKTDPSSQFTYTTSPNSPDLILLPLDSAWSTDEPPYSLISTISPGPSYAWHTIATTSSELLVFGGDGGAGIASPSGTDSAWTLSLRGEGGKASWTQQPSGLAEQPPRRRYLSSVSHGDEVWITGGEAPDGSGTIYCDVYYYSSSNGFVAGPPLPVGVFHHMSTMLPNGTLVVLGGAYMSPNTGMAALTSLDRFYLLDTTSATSLWTTGSIAGKLPDGRRGAAGVLVGDDRIWMLGGADARLDSVLGDVWILDLQSLSWTEVQTTSSPTARYDHTAILGPSGQIVLFGGYASDGPTDTGTYVFDTSSNNWVTSYSPTPSMISPPASSSVGPAESSGASKDGVTRTNSLGQTVTTDRSTTSPSSSTSNAALPSLDRGLSVPAQVGIVLGALALLASLVGAIFLLCRRRKHRRTLEAAQSWDAERRGMIEARGLAKSFDRSEKEWRSPSSPTSDHPPSPPIKERYGVIGLGMGAIGAGIHGFSRVANRALSNPRKDYTALQDEAFSPTGSTSPRKDGSTIRLIGPRDMPNAPSRATSPRLNMLEQEDSRSFAAIPEEDEPITAKGRTGGLRPFNELLRQDSGEKWEGKPLIPPTRVRGGPVPTPSESTTDLNPFADTSFDITDIPSVAVRDADLPMSSSYRVPSLNGSDPLDLAGLLVPRLYEDAESSLPRSHRSSTYTASDIEEGVVLQAQSASATSAAFIASPCSPQGSDGIISPVPDVYAPIKRTETFFRRMTAGGITGLLGRSDSLQSRHQSPPIRDPAEPPLLWPVNRDTVSAWDDADLERPPRLGHTRENISLSSLQSAKSMRDMVIIQRHESASSIESQAIVEQSTGQSADFDPPSSSSIVPIVPISATPRKLRPTPSEPPSATSSKTTSTTKSDPALPPSGSPLPAHLVSHRRPVKDMVFSINKRSSRVFNDVSAAALSPESEYSPATTPRPERQATTYETARRSPLTVANPDFGRNPSG